MNNRGWDCADTTIGWNWVTNNLTRPTWANGRRQLRGAGARRSICGVFDRRAGHKLDGLVNHIRYAAVGKLRDTAFASFPG